MTHHSKLPPIEWAKRVNRSWLVRGGLNDTADAWMDYLASAGGDRLLRSCEGARAMCGIRNPLEDPKPWFYAGLFRLATPAEVRRFLRTHRTTKATVPAMAEDEDVVLWLDRVGVETRNLMARLREGIASLD